MTIKPLAQSQRFSRRLTLLVAAPLALAGLFVVAITTTNAAAADEAISVITLHHVDHAPSTPTAARRLYHRLDQAALTVCGGGDGSLALLNQTVHGSDCWHAAMRNAVAQVDSPRLREVLADNRKP